MILSFYTLNLFFIVIFYLAYIIVTIGGKDTCYYFNNYCIIQREKHSLIKYSIITNTVIYDAINFHYNVILKYHILGHYYIALDEESFYYMKNYTTNLFLLSLNFTDRNNFDYGTKNYGKIVLSKTKINFVLLKLKRNILLTDIDIYYFNNPFNDFLQYKEDLIITKDGFNSVNTGL